jgi:hypothetical protein
MSTIVNRVPVAAAIGLVAGILIGVAVATAMSRNLHLYQRFIGLAVITALAVVGVAVYRTYIRPASPAVEEMDAEGAS